MARPRLPVLPYLPHEEIARRYRACRDGVEKTHWQALWLLSRPEDPPSPAAVAAAIGLSPGGVRALIKRWNAEGPDGLADRRKAANGGRHALTTEQRLELWSTLQASPPDGGLWTGPKVAAYVRDRWGVAASKPSGRRWLRGLGFSPQVPRPEHPEAATPAEVRAWKRSPARPAR